MEAEKETTQSKSNAVSEDAPLTEESSVTKSPDTLNGEDTVESVEKTEGEDEASVEMKDKPVEESEKVEETVREEKSRKRKAPADDSLSEESSGETRGDAKEESPVAPTLIREESVKPVGSDEIPVLEQLADLSMPPKQTLGKGKRARIPNKRYSDILLSPQSRSHKSSVENGEKVSDRLESESEFNDKDEESTNTSLKPQPSTNTPAPKKAKLSVDLSSPAYKVPFTCGWRRELVYRNGSDLTKKIMGDIYYYSPGGKKIRSMREMIDHLKTESGELSSVNFTFYREPLGLDDPAKELVRPAKQWSKKSRGGLKSPKVANTAKSPRASPRANDTPAEAVTASPKARTSTRNLGNIKVKLPPAKTKAEKLKEKEEAMEAEPTPTRRQGTRRSAKMPSKAVEPPKAKRRSTKANSVSSNEKIEEPKFMDSYLQNLSYGYSTLLHVFQYLKVQDLLRAGCVCTMWRDIASHPSLWRTVRMKNSQVHSFEGLANSLQKHGTVQLDLRKMLLPASGNSGDDIWPEFSKAIEKVETLRKIELCRCPASVVQSLLETNRDLEVINAVTIKCESIDLEKVSSVKNLKELRIKSTGGLTLTSDITSLKELTNLMHLSLTSIKSLHKLDLSVIASLTKLETLDLGECNDFPENFGAEILIKLDKLEKLRLEKGQGNCHTFEILEAVQNMPQLEQLELVNFDIKGGFDTALGACANIKKLLIIPTYISQSATTNHMVLGGVLRLQTTLSYFVWGVTLELLRVTELFVDQCEDPDMKEKKEKKPTGSGDSIPVLKPVPSIINSDDSILPAHDPPQVEILPLPNLQKLLLQSLPTTRVKILKIPFHATWRQSITDTVN